MTAVPRARAGLPAAQVDAVVDATRVIGALIATTLAHVEPHVTMPQWRVLVLASDAGCPISAVAGDLHIHPSNATRIVDRLVAAGLVEKRRGTVDRRRVLAVLTPAGRDLYERAMDLRRARVTEAMSGMGAEQREQLVQALSSFGDRLRAGSDPSPEGPTPSSPTRS